MEYMASGAFPVLLGKADRVRNFGKELATNQAEFERLCRKCGGFTHFNVTLQEGPMGDLCIYSMVFDDPSEVRMSFGDSVYDKWWVGFVKDVHGFDISAGSPPPPPSVFTWQAK
jgi:hypothetical protein